MSENKRKYLGEEVIDIATHHWTKDKTTTDWINELILGYGQIDGGHHKQWCMDQVLRINTGSTIIAKIARWSDGMEELRWSVGEPTKAYLDMIKEYEEEDEYGDRLYHYDVGVAP